jgi:hypothetical protein
MQVARCALRVVFFQHATRNPQQAERENFGAAAKNH